MQEKALSLLLNLSLDNDNKVGLVVHNWSNCWGFARWVAELPSFGGDYADELGGCGNEQGYNWAYPYAIRALASLPINGKRLLGERERSNRE